MDEETKLFKRRWEASMEIRDTMHAHMQEKLAEIEQLKAVLKPFADLAKDYDHYKNRTDVWIAPSVPILVDQLRAARAALLKDYPDHAEHRSY